MNSYRFVSGQEPSDEMLSQLMSEVAEEAVERRKRADDEYFSQMRRNVAAKKERCTKFHSAVFSQAFPL